MTPSVPPFSWTSGGLHPEVFVGVTGLGAAYLWAWLRRGERPRAGRVASFFGGLVLLAGALNGPLHDLSDYYLFSAHMVQHLILTLAVPPLLLAGTPAWLADGAIRAVGGWRPAHAFIVAITRPLPALSAYAVALFVWHLPGPYEAALLDHRWHIAQHLTLMTTAMLGWWPVLSPSTLAPRLPYGAQILYLFVFGMPMTVVAAMITGAEQLLYPTYASAPRLFELTPVNDQRLGGVIMWVPAGLVPLVAFSVVFFRWVAAEDDGT